MLEIGENWSAFGINEVITTNENLKKYAESIFRNLVTEVIPIGIPNYFKNSDKPKIPTIAISARDKREILKIVKVFFQKYPHYRFITFRDMSGLPRKEFAKTLSESFLGVWVDELSSFGTFPLEAIKSKTPVIGKIPRMIPEWMGETDENGSLKLIDNGVWVTNLNAIPDMISTMVGLYLEDALPQNVLSKMEEYENKYSEEETRQHIKEVYNRIFSRRLTELGVVDAKETENNKKEEITTK
tara:strand:- start:238 stop:963 length:726 start_codon:yes stop_codon:yes gene_type:complete